MLIKLKIIRIRVKITLVSNCH